MQPHWDIFCRVIDNYGDIGVCWRLARQLAHEQGKSVRLWVDDLYSFKPLDPGIDPMCARQSIDNVDIILWQESLDEPEVGDVVIEAFACELPESYIQAMARQACRPVWINLEYLSAEPWVDSCHGMASPHPTLPLTKYFFFPGFGEKTGGLLREHDALHHPPPPLTSPPERLLSLFCYDDAPVGMILDELARQSIPARCRVPPGKPLAAVSSFLASTPNWESGPLHIEAIPFSDQPGYDALLRESDINFVRGEDSFLRAQWAGKPFVWQIYRQAENAHLDKLEAFLARYTSAFDDPTGQIVGDMFRAWNTGKGVTEAWQKFLAHQPEILTGCRRWQAALAAHDDLATSLVKFCAAKV